MSYKTSIKNNKLIKHHTVRLYKIININFPGTYKSATNISSAIEIQLEPQKKFRGLHYLTEFNSLFKFMLLSRFFRELEVFSSLYHCTHKSTVSIRKLLYKLLM